MHHTYHTYKVLIVLRWIACGNIGVLVGSHLDSGAFCSCWLISSTDLRRKFWNHHCQLTYQLPTARHLCLALQHFPASICCRSPPKNEQELSKKYLKLLWKPAPLMCALQSHWKYDFKMPISQIFEGVSYRLLIFISIHIKICWIYE